MNINEEKINIVINNYFKTECSVDTTIREAFEKGFRLGIKKVKEKEHQWIPCSKKLPSEKDGQILVTKRDEVMIAVYSEFSGRWYLGDMCAVGSENPIAWMPLPTPYRKDSEV